jgi:hypothetical protein
MAALTIVRKTIGVGSGGVLIVKCISFVVSVSDFGLLGSSSKASANSRWECLLDEA